MPIIEPSWSCPCPECGGNVRRKNVTAQRRAGAKARETRYNYECENEDGKRVRRHVPVNWQPPTS